MNIGEILGEKELKNFFLAEKLTVLGCFGVILTIKVKHNISGCIIEKSLHDPLTWTNVHWQPKAAAPQAVSEDLTFSALTSNTVLVLNTKFKS